MRCPVWRGSGRASLPRPGSPRVSRGPQRRTHSSTYGNLKVDDFVRVGAHVVVEAELVVADLLGGEDEVTLALLGAIEDDLLLRPRHFVVEIERASGLHLSCSRQRARGRAVVDTPCLQQSRMRS